MSEAKKKKGPPLRQARLSTTPEEVLAKLSPALEAPSPIGVSSPVAQGFPKFSPSFQQQMQREPAQFAGFSQFQPRIDIQELYAMQAAPSLGPILLNGSVADINDVVREIVTEREPAPHFPSSEEVSYICPMSLVPITCPARGVNCQHLQCFDLREFLQLLSENKWECPICGARLSYEELRFDPFYYTAAPAPETFSGQGDMQMDFQPFEAPNPESYEMFFNF